MSTLLLALAGAEAQHCQTTLAVLCCSLWLSVLQAVDNQQELPNL